MKEDSKKTDNKIDVSYVADLARISLSEEEKLVFGRQLDNIVEYFAKLSELDVSDIEPTAHAAPVENVLRKDTPAPGMTRDQMLKNAPMHDDAHIVVPKILA